jgi:hypothetical protein
MISEEMLLSHGFTASNYTDTRALTWDEVTNFFKRAIDVQLKGHQELRNVRDLRHILTHKRGELRTTEDRERFGKDDAGWIGYQVELTEVSTSKHLDVLAKHVRRLDVAAYPVAHAGKAPAGFAALLPGRRA